MNLLLNNKIKIFEMRRYFLRASNDENNTGKSSDFLRKNPYKINKKEIAGEDKIFPYLIPFEKSVIFQDDDNKIENLYNSMKGKIRYVICILIENDSYNNSQMLRRTLNSFIDYIISLKDMLFKGTEIFNENDIKKIEKINQYILSKKHYYINEDHSKHIEIHCISKINYFNEVEILKCFYCSIINQLKIKEGIIFSSILTAGLEIKAFNNDIKSLLLLSYNSSESHNIIVPLIEENNNDDLISKIKKYERINFNLYNLNFYDMTQSVPISSYFNLMTIDDNLFYDLKKYYKNIRDNQSIDFHDYNISLFLSRRGHSIIYYNPELIGEINLTNFMDISIPDYRDNWIKRYSGYYANFFELLRVLIDCNNFNIFKKIFLSFQIIGYIVDFIFPSLSSIVIYTVLYEAFNIYDILPSSFLTSLYLFLFICSGTTSLISKNSNKMILTNIILYIFMEIFYFFIFICSTVAIHNIRMNKNSDSYEFDKFAISFIIILTFIPSIIPLFMKCSLIFENIIPFLLYFLLAASQSTSNYTFAKILNSCESFGGIYINESKGIIILIYFLFNLFFGSFILFNYTRKRRIITIMALGICFLLYNFFKQTAIIINLIINSKKFIIQPNALQEIKKELQKYDHLKFSSTTMWTELKNGKSIEPNFLESISESNMANSF